MKRELIGPRTDRVTDRVERVFRERYTPDHPNAEVMAYRYNGYSILVRVIDPDFEGMDIVDRNAPFERIIPEFPEAVQERLYMLLTLTPEEARESETSAEFDAAAKLLAKKKSPARNGRAKSGRP